MDELEELAQCLSDMVSAWRSLEDTGVLYDPNPDADEHIAIREACV